MFEGAAREEKTDTPRGRAGGGAGDEGDETEAAPRERGDTGRSRKEQTHQSSGD